MCAKYNIVESLRHIFPQSCKRIVTAELTEVIRVLQFLNPNPAGRTLVVREKRMEEDRELLRMWFESVDEDNSNSINAQELQVVC